MDAILKLIFRGLRKGLRFLRARFAAVNPLRLLRRWIHSPDFLGERYTLVDNTQVTLFSDRPELCPGYRPRRGLAESPRVQRVQVSVVATARNEAGSARTLIESLLSQTRLPDEIVMIDTGSQDGTLVLLQELAAESQVPFRVLAEPGANIARGRNLAIAQARSEVIAVTDFGCRLAPDWLENLVAPFEIDPGFQVSAGRYQAVGPAGQRVRWLLGRTLEEIEPQSYLPSAVSVAFTKEAWRGAGGYPEWLSLTGEDTYFGLELKRTTTRWAFVPEAVVEWEAPQRLRDCWRKAYRWSTGDGEAGTTTRAYRWLVFQLGTLALGASFLLALAAAALLTGAPALQIAAALAGLGGVGWFARRMRKSGLTGRGLLLRLGTNAAQVAGFLAGWRRRPQVDRRREAGLQGTFFILAGVPIDDTGGGARWTQIALELIRRHFLVVFIHKFPKYERVDLNLSLRHPNLVAASLDGFRWERFEKQHAALLSARPVTALAELPLAGFLPLLEEVRGLGGVTVYDLLDDWATSLGGEWYTEASEQQVIETSDVLVATAPALQERLERRSGRAVRLLPNAVNSFLFDPGRFYPAPADLPPGAWRAIYTGALWGEWFDWELLLRTARAYPQAAVVVIGDYAGQCPDPPPNLHFLGLKAQRDLPAYLAHAQVALLPWRITPITQATSPLKVYEYIAMQKPVVAPDLRPLHGLPGVSLIQGAEAFIAEVGAAAYRRVDEEAAIRFVNENDWQKRVADLLALAQAARQAPQAGRQKSGQAGFRKSGQARHG